MRRSKLDAYDANGNRTTLIDPDNGSHVYTYDANNRQAAQKSPSNQRFTMAYDADSRMVTVALANGGVRSFQYDNAGRLITQIELNAASVPVMMIVDTYNANNWKVTQTRDVVATNYAYDDAASRLTTTQQGTSRATYTYDDNGNLANSRTTKIYDRRSARLELEKVLSGPPSSN